VLWQAALAAEQGDWEEAIDGFSRSANLIGVYPTNIQRKLGLLAAETVIANENYEAAKSFLDPVKESDPSASELNYASYLLGEAFMATDATDNAMAIWDKVIEGSDRRMEEILHHEQEALSEFVDNAPIGFYSVDEQGKFLLVNSTLARWLECSADEIIGGDLHLHDFITDSLPASLAPHEPGLRAVKSSLDSAPITRYDRVTLRGRKGRVVEAQISQKQSPGGGGEPLTRSVVHDVTAERELERALRQSVQRFQRFFDAAPGGIAELDPDGAIVECNLAMRVLLGAGERDVAGWRLAEFIAPQDQDKFEKLLAGAVSESDKGGSAEVRLAIGDEGESGHVASFFASRLEDDDGEMAGLILHGVDTSERKSLEMQFAQSQKMEAVGQLAGGIAHDFNNLLTAMIGFCDLLLIRHKPGDQSFADIMQIKQNANRAANLVRQLLAFSRQQTVQSKVLNVTEVLADLSHLMRRLIGVSIELKMTHGRDLGVVLMDQGQLEQIVVNLAVNARDAMPEGGALSVRTENVSLSDPAPYGSEVMPVGDYVLIEVVDSGQGIEKEILDRIFEPFFSTKEVGLGTGLGLGLSTVHGIIRQADGFVFVDSEPGQGTRFSIFLPRYVAQSQEEEVVQAGEGEEAVPATRDLTGTGTVLLVEDEDAVRMFSARALRNKGYKVLEACSGVTATELINITRDPIDLLITDVVMPDMDGPALIEWIQENRPQIKVICISGYAEESFRQRLDRSTDIHFLAKPFSLDELAGKVKEVMQQAAA